MMSNENPLKTFIKNKIIGTQYEGRGYIDNLLLLYDANIRNYPGQNLLDVGCADGYKTTLFANYFSILPNQVFGLDIEKDYLIKSREKFNVVQSNLEKTSLPFKDNTFELVICNQVLEHLVHYRAVLEDITRITRLGGYVTVGIPNLAHLINRIYLLFGFQPLSIDLNGPHVRGFTHRSFKIMLRSLSKLRLIDYKGQIMYPLPRGIARILCQYFIGLTGYTCYLLQKV